MTAEDQLHRRRSRPLSPKDSHSRPHPHPHPQSPAFAPIASGSFGSGPGGPINNVTGTAAPSGASLGARAHGLPRRNSTIGPPEYDAASRPCAGANTYNDSLESSDPLFSSSSWAHFSFAFAVLPAVAGILFENGNVIGTDMMLLVLCSAFLRWCVTQPWKWYHTARQVRFHQEVVDNLVAIDDTARDNHDDDVTDEYEYEDDSEDTARPTKAPARKATGIKQAKALTPSQREQLAREKALGQLYRHEVTALVCCFLCPLLGAYLLHHIRSQLSRPSEGLVSDFNLTIFLLASELRPVTHVMKLLQSRTLHLQRVLAENPYHNPSRALAQSRVEALIERLDELEARVSTALKPSHAQTLDRSSFYDSDSPPSRRFPTPKTQDTTIAREVQRFLQPELEVLSRAVRRAEKRTMTLAVETDSRLQRLAKGMEDSIALAAAAARTSAAAAETGMLRSAVDSATALMMLPLNVIGSIVFPFTTLWSLVGRAGPLKILGPSSESRPERHYMPSRVRNERIMATTPSPPVGN